LASDPVLPATLRSTVLKLYYDIHGAGQPLILLHGGVGAIEM
jgi:hypothetical protein